MVDTRGPQSRSRAEAGEVVVVESALADRTPACEAARSNHADARKRLGQWKLYLLIAGAILLALIAVAAYLFATGTTSQAALSTGAAIADGAALAWIVARRNEAEKAVRRWFGQVVKECSEAVVEEQRALW